MERSQVNNEKMKRPQNGEREGSDWSEKTTFLIGKLRRMRVISEKGRDRRGPGDGLNHKIGGDRGQEVDDGQIGMETASRRLCILLKGTRKRREAVQITTK